MWAAFNAMWLNNLGIILTNALICMSSMEASTEVLVKILSNLTLKSFLLVYFIQIH